MVTIYDIANKANVSPSTVSKVINNYSSIPEETKKKVKKAMDELNYIPNASAKALSQGRSYNIGVLAYLGEGISSFKHPLFMNILHSFQEEMDSKNYDLLFISANAAGQAGSFLQNCISRDVAGVLLFGDLNSPEIHEVIESNIPKVAFDYMGEDMSGVCSDNYAQMKLLTKHLIDEGHSNIVFIHGEDNDVTKSRIQAFKDALSEANIPWDDRYLVEGIYMNSTNMQSLTKNVLRRILPPTAIMYPDDLSAIDGMKVIKEMGLRIPEDISVTGYDGTFISKIVTPPLTTVKQDAKAIGKALANELIRQIEDGNKEKKYFEVPSSIIIGESSGSLKKKNDR